MHEVDTTLDVATGGHRESPWWPAVAAYTGVRPASDALRGLELRSGTRLQLAPGVRTRLDPGGHVLVDSPDGTVVDAGPRGFRILSLFAPPLTLGEAIDRLEHAEDGATDLVPSLSVLNMLFEEGALVPSGSGRALTRGWADPVEHARMLHDDRRTGDYIAALADAVQPGDVVLDLGTGSGVLAIAAARAGAARVYAVEATDIAEVARRVFAANGVDDRVTLIGGWSRQIELPEPADLLVAEIIGNDPFEEEILETTFDARRRLLKPGARLVPHALTLFAHPLLVPHEQARQRAIGRDAVERWRRLYGMDFQPLLDAASPRAVHNPTEGEVVSEWPPVGPPALLTTVDLTTVDRPVVDAEADLELESGDAMNAVAVTFNAHLHGSHTHTLSPWTWPISSWATSVWVLPDTVFVAPGAVLRVRYTRRVAGVPDGLTWEAVDESSG